MEKIVMKSMKHKPEIILDPDKNTFYIAGASFPEDAIRFYAPVVRWLNEYSDLSDTKEKFQATFKLTYLNSSSHRLLLEIFHLLKKMKEKGMSLQVDWHYEKYDVRVLESGQELSDMAELPVNMIEYE